MNSVNDYLVNKIKLVHSVDGFQYSYLQYLSEFNDLYTLNEDLTIKKQNSIIIQEALEHLITNSNSITSLRNQLQHKPNKVLNDIQK